MDSSGKKELKRQIRPLLVRLGVWAILPSAAALADAPAASDRSRVCPPPPTLALSPDFEEPQHPFAPSGRAFRSVEKRFGEAYRIECRRGMVTVPLMPEGPSGPGRLVLRNAPEANTTSIYKDESAGSGPRPMVIEHPFLGDRGRVGIPSVDDLRRAIVCAVHASDPPPNPPVGDILECLVD